MANYNTKLSAATMTQEFFNRLEKADPSRAAARARREFFQRKASEVRRNLLSMELKEVRADSRTA